MPDEYTLYEAKAKLSQLVRKVREGHSVIITVHGVPAAELRPIDPAPRVQTLEERLAELEARGLVSRARVSPSDPNAFTIGKPVPGGLARFLAERD